MSLNVTHGFESCLKNILHEPTKLDSLRILKASFSLFLFFWMKYFCQANGLESFAGLTITVSCNICRAKSTINSFGMMSIFDFAKGVDDDMVPYVNDVL